MKQKKMLIATTAIFSLLMATTAFAGTWQTGKDANQDKWWYDNGDGTYMQNGWQWIDGNGDGIAECYYFDNGGWLLTNTATPDGYQVNSNGAWVTNGIVEVKNTSHAEESNSIISSPKLDGVYFPKGSIDNGNYSDLGEDDDVEMVRFSIQTINEKTILLEYNLGMSLEYYVWNGSKYVPDNMDTYHYYNEIYAYGDDIVAYKAEKSFFDDTIWETRIVYKK